MEKITLDVHPFNINEMQWNTHYMLYDATAGNWYSVLYNGTGLESWMDESDFEAAYYNITHMTRMPHKRDVKVTWSGGDAV